MSKEEQTTNNPDSFETSDGDKFCKCEKPIFRANYVGGLYCLICELDIE